MPSAPLAVTGEVGLATPSDGVSATDCYNDPPNMHTAALSASSRLQRGRRVRSVRTPPVASEPTLLLHVARGYGAATPAYVRETAYKMTGTAVPHPADGNRPC